MITLYQLSPYIDPSIRAYGMFEFFGMVDGPDPRNYLKVWEGELGTTDLEKIYTRLCLYPPKGYRASRHEKNDVIAMGGDYYFLDHDGYQKVAFDSDGIKTAVHVSYGFGVSLENAVILPSDLLKTAKELGIPFGHMTEPEYHGSRKGESSFDSGISDRYGPHYLHPQFLASDEAREFIHSLEMLSRMENWPESKCELMARRPVSPMDLQQVKESREKLMEEGLRQREQIVCTMSDVLAERGCDCDWCHTLANMLFDKGIMLADIINLATTHEQQVHLERSSDMQALG